VPAVSAVGASRRPRARSASLPADRARRLRGALALVAAVSCAGLLGACRRRETPDAARARAHAAFLHRQIEGFEALVAKAEGGGLETHGQIAVGVSEAVVKTLVDASLPQKVTLGGRVELTLESARAFFRGSRSALALRASLRSTKVESTHARVELAGVLKDFEMAGGKLSTSVSLIHFTVLEASLGDLGADVVERLVKQNLAAIERAIPPVVIPVSIEEKVRIGGLSEGPVIAKSGALPLAFTVAQVIPAGERLWILLDAKAGPWETVPAEAKP
jgi:hypothetical protein